MDQFSFLSSPVATALGYAVIFSLGQAFVVFLCVRLLLKLIPQASSRLKYLLLYVAYLLTAGWFIGTFFHHFVTYHVAPAASGEIGSASFSTAISDGSPASIFSISFLNDYLPLIAAFYYIGIIWCFGKLLLHFIQVNRLRNSGLSGLDEAWQQRIERLSNDMDIHRSVKAFFSRNVNTPMMIGIFKPLILLPVAAVSQLTTEQLESILIHELAHIRRNDYLLNVVQSLFDALFFFNPFTRWLSSKIREEREKSCDEMVLEMSDPYHYARALLALEEPLHSQPLVMTAVNQRSYLFHRIKNIMEMRNKSINLRQKFITLGVVAVAAMSIAWLSPSENRDTSKVKPQPRISTYFAPSIPADFNFMPNNAGVDSAPQLLRDSAPAGLTPPPPPSLPPAPPVAMQGRPGVPLPPVAPVPPGMGPVSPLPALPPPPPPAPPMQQLKDTFPSGSGFFNSKEWKAEQEAIRKSTQEMRNYFQSGAWKKQQALIRQNAVAMKKYFNSPEWKKQQELMQKNGAEMKKYFNSPAWKKQQEDIQKSASKMKEYFDSPEWKKQQEEFQKNASKMQEYFNSPEWKKQQEEFQKNASKMQEYFNSPEWKKQQEEISHATDSLTTYFKSTDWKKQQENIQKVVAQSQQFFQTDQWKNLQKDLEQFQWDAQKQQKDASHQK